jgi:hypothetical protein
MLLCVSLRRVLSVLRSMNGMTPCCMGVVCRLLMAPGLMMRCRFAVVAGRVAVVFRCPPVVFRRLLRHATPP